MPHDVPGQVHWHEPAGGEQAGLTTFRRPPSAYDAFMAAEGIPCFRGPGIDSLRRLPLAPWPRLGGRGSYIQLEGTEGQWGCHLVEVPAGSALPAERHLYDKVMLVIEGRGSTEIDVDGGSDGGPQRFEWQPGSMFAVPLNARHRLVNGSAAPALLLAGTTAPTIINHLGGAAAVFACDRTFGDGAAAGPGGIEPDPLQGLASLRTALLADAAGCPLPLDNRRSPGYRRLAPVLAGDAFQISIGQHRTGRYARAHVQTAPAMAICLAGRGYTLLWPEAAGPTPWRDGRGDVVRRVDFGPFGVVATAPPGGRWFHQHFGIGPGPLRLATWYGPAGPVRLSGPPGAVQVDETVIEHPRGTAIPYWMEDPQVRRDWQAAVAAAGQDDRMLPSFYEPP